MGRDKSPEFKVGQHVTCTAGAGEGTPVEARIATINVDGTIEIEDVHGHRWFIAPAQRSRLVPSRKTSDKIAPDAALEMIAVELATRTTWTGELGNRIAEIVTRAGFKVAAPASEPTPATGPELILACPKCGCTDHEKFQVRETFRAYHEVDDIEDGVLVVNDALTSDVPSEHFDDGDGDLVMICQECTHEADPNMFGAPPSLEWDWR